VSTGGPTCRFASARHSQPRHQALTRGDREIHLERKAFELLAALALDRPNVLPKRRSSSGSGPRPSSPRPICRNLVGNCARRSATGRAPPKFIRTVHGVGLRVLRATRRRCGGACRESARPSCWLEWGRKRFPLSSGAHVIGRSADVEVRLDAPSVSRRHARLVVTPGGTVLEDFGSKNGTFRGETRVTAPIALADGDAIRIGLLLVIFPRTPPSPTRRRFRVVTPNVRPPIAIGTRIDRYEIVGWLGAGGMGDVYRARDLASRTRGRDQSDPGHVRDDAGRLQRFEQEARATGQLNHPNILVVHDTGVHEGAPYIVSELLDGESLRSRLAGAH